MDIPESLLDTEIDILFSDEKKDRGIVYNARLDQNADYVLQIVVASIEFDKADVLETGEGFIRVNFEGHKTSPAI